MSNREKLPEWIVRFNEKDLSDAERTGFQELMARNPALEREVRLDAELNDELSDEELLDLHSKILQARNPTIRMNDPGRKLIVFAAAVLALIMLEIVITHLCSRPGLSVPDRNQTAGNTISDQKNGTSVQEQQHPVRPGEGQHQVILPEKKEREKQSQLLANHFQPNPMLEALVGSAVRSGTFKLLNPRPGDHCAGNEEIRFRWETDIEKPLKIIIVDNQGTIRYESDPVRKDHMDIDCAGLLPGLYYFKIILNGELIYLGKFPLD